MFESVVETIDFSEQGGILHMDGERVIVKNAIPGQKVRFVVNKREKANVRARLLEVFGKSPARNARRESARTLAFMAAACIRACHMRSS